MGIVAIIDKMHNTWDTTIQHKVFIALIMFSLHEQYIFTLHDPQLALIMLAKFKNSEVFIAGQQLLKSSQERQSMNHQFQKAKFP